MYINGTVSNQKIFHYGDELKKWICNVGKTGPSPNDYYTCCLYVLRNTDYLLSQMHGHNCLITLITEI